MRQNKLLLLLVLLLMAATGAWAQEETLLTTITATSKDSYSETTAGVVTVTHDNSDIYGEYGWVWWANPGSITVEAKEGYTITRCVFRQSSKTPVTVSTSPFKVSFIETANPSHPNQKKFLYQGDWNLNMNGVSSIEVYGYANAPAAPGYSVTLAEGTEDSDNWTISPAEAAEGDKVTVTYSGEKKVKSVKAVKKAAVDPAKAYLTWDADQKKLVATEIPATATKVENASTDVDWQGTYVVEGEDVKINGTITLKDDVNLIIKDGAKLTAQKIRGNKNLSIYGQAQMTGELVVDNSGDDAITSIKTLEVHSAKVTATSSARDRGGIYYIGTINVYDGSVDAKNTAADGGYGIWLKPDGSINIYGGEVKAVGKGNRSYGYGITAGNTATVTVNGGKLWAENADKQALYSKITLKKGEGFSGKIEYSSDKSTWSETVDANAKYVRVGYN